jgi:hypothetical protein
MESILEGKTTASQEIHDLGARLHLIRRPPETLIAKVFCLMEDEGLLDTVWHAGKITLSQVLADAAKPSQVYYTYLTESLETKRITLAGMGWAHDITPLANGKFRASVGMAFFRDSQCPKLTKEFCSMALDDGFDNLALEAAYGYAPLNNRAACIFHRRMGFSVIGIAPHYSNWQGTICDVQISCLTREHWEQIQRSKIGQVGAEDAA